MPGYFYPRSPCGERHGLILPIIFRTLFLSTLSLRRATIKISLLFRPLKNFYPRSPCGERRGFGAGSWRLVIFLSTLSLRRATESIGTLRTVSVNFYPRSPCGERHLPSKPIERKLYFYPRSPCGERLDKRCQFNGDNGFLSTLSLRRATTH